MTYTPYIPSQGVAGWNFLQTTYDRQFDAFTRAGDLSNDTDYFLENISSIQTSEDLLNDRRLLEVAVKAFGLQEEIDYRALLQRVLNEGTTASDALANTLDDQRYVELSEAFGFGSGQSLKTADKGAMQSIVDAFNTASFEEAVGTQDVTMRNALFAQRSFPELLGDTVDESGGDVDIRRSAVDDFMERISALSDDEEDETQTIEEKWKELLNRDVLDTLFDTAFGMGTDVLLMSEDERVDAYIDRAEELLGTADPAIFFSEDNSDTLIQMFTTQANQSNSLTASEITETAELGGRLLESMVAQESAVNAVWTDLLENSQTREFFQVALNLSDLDTLDPNTAVELVKRKSVDVFGSNDPRVFASDANRDDTMDAYRAAATEQGLSSGEMSRTIAVSNSIFNITVPENTDTSDAAALDAKWLAVMTQGILPSFFGTAFQLPDDFQSLTIDEQLETYKNQSLANFGTNDPEEVFNTYNTETIFTLYRTNAEAEGELGALVTYTEQLAHSELEKLFPPEEEQDIDSLLEDIFGEEEDRQSEIDTTWFTIMGQEALIDFMRTTLSLPKEVGQMDIDQALEVYKNRAQQVLGTDDPAIFANSENMEGLIDRYLAQAQISGVSGGSSPTNSALLSLFS